MDGLETGGRRAMISFLPDFGRRRTPEILFIGAHSDDLEIGCGGAVIELGKRFPRAAVRWLVLSGAGIRRAEAERSARMLLRSFRSAAVAVTDFRDGFLPQAYGEIKEFFEAQKHLCRPDLILTHALHDRHQDHRLAAELTWNTWRDAAILEYEIPKYEGDLGTPNVYLPLARAVARRKVAHLMRHFVSQRGRRWFAQATFESHLRLRGLECNAVSGYAEAFHGRKICL